MFKSEISKNLDLQRKLNKTEEKLDRSRVRIILLGFLTVTFAAWAIMAMIGLERSYDTIDRMRGEVYSVYGKCDSLQYVLRVESEK